MTNAEFDELVRRLELQAAASPRLYNFRLTLLALLGNADQLNSSRQSSLTSSSGSTRCGA